MIQGNMQPGGTYIFPGSRGNTYIRPPYAMRGVGADPAAQPSSAMQTLKTVYTYASPVSSLACAYHGYKRNQSIGWALWWALMGGLFPLITPVIALAQGFGERGKG